MNSPLLYEINTRCWLRELADHHQRAVTLATVPEAQFKEWQRLGFTHIWLMGVWPTGPRARAIALAEPDLRRAYDAVLPGWREEDVGGSPYAIAAYEVSPALGGEVGLKKFRTQLHQHGMKLILDFVPNHLGIDHSWVATQPELFVQSAKEVAGTFAAPTAAGPCWIANGKDPYFAPWTDVAQLDYRRAGTHAAMQKLLLSIAARCDGVRCDMAMLLLNEVFAKTWAHLPTSESPPAGEFWARAISAVKQAQPGFTFMAEVYWGLEGRLQSLGFDYTYDKQLYDELIGRQHPRAQQQLLAAPPEYVAASVHFLENHDEERVAAKLASEENRAAALAILGLPGMRFLHEGQLTGARLKLPVQLARRPSEPVQSEVCAAYEKLLTALKSASVGRGRGQILAPRAAWDGNPTGQNFIIVQWQERLPGFDLVVVNLASHRSQCYVTLSAPGLAEHHWSMRDRLSEERHVRVGSDIVQQGLYLDLPAHGAQVFHFAPVP